MGRKSLLNKEGRNKLIQLWNTNCTISDLQSELGISRITIRREAKKLGLPASRPKASHKNHPSAIAPDRINDANVLLTSYSVKEVSEKTGLSISFLHTKCAVPERITPSDDEIVEKYILLRSISGCSRALHISCGKIKMVLKRKGVPIARSSYDLTEWKTIDPLIEEGISKGINSYTALAKVVGIPTHVLTMRIKEKYNHFQKEKLYRNLGEISEREQEEIISAYVDNGIPKKRVCAIFRISSNVFDKIVSIRIVRRYIPEDRVSEFLEYSKKVRRLSHSTRVALNAPNISGHHWDHRLSVADCFLNNVPVDVAACWENLVLIPSSKNVSKSHRSSITIEELYRLRGEIR